MSAEVRDSYDAMADLYASFNLDALDHDTNARDWLVVFAKLAAPRRGFVADLGCGPGHIVHHLSDLDLNVIGYDLSEGQIAQARKAFPGSDFHIGDLAALDVDDSSIGGIVSRYSIIHIEPSLLSDVFDEWIRVLEPEAPVLISFFGALIGLITVQRRDIVENTATPARRHRRARFGSSEAVPSSSPSSA